MKQERLLEPERWRQIEEVFHQALERDPRERAAFLDQACAGDEALRREVESLLGHEDEAENFIEAPALEIAARGIVAEQARSLVGEQIGRYQIRSVLGEGGMGKVYLAEDTQLGRQVALKMLPIAFTKDADRVGRFEQEAKAASALNHPNIITIHEIGQHGELHFIVSEFIEGQTLRELMTAARLGVREAVEIAAQIASALKAAHTAGIIHGDIKPENIMVRPDSLVKVLDFGIARVTERRSPGTETRANGIDPVSEEPGMIAGTASYMSPEQARGEPLDARTDLFSLGVVLYEMVAGQRPFAGESRAEVLQSLLGHDEPAPLSALLDEVPAALERIARKALRKRRDERYASASEMLDDLRALQHQLETGASRSASGFWSLLKWPPGRQAERARTAIPKDIAFHGLKPFQEADRDHFYGRETEALEVFQMVAHEEFRCGVLYGDSGCGKTSLIKAGLMPRLRQAGWLLLYCRSYREPLATLLEEGGKQSRIAPRAGELPIGYLR